MRFWVLKNESKMERGSRVLSQWNCVWICSILGKKLSHLAGNTQGKVLYRRESISTCSYLFMVTGLHSYLETEFLPLEGATDSTEAAWQLSLNTLLTQVVEQDGFQHPAVMLEDIWRAPNIKEVCYGKMNLIIECFTLLCLVRPVCKFTRDKKLICVFLHVYNDKLISNHILLMALPPGPIRRHVDSMSTSGGYTSKGLIQDYKLWYEYKASTYEEHLK